MLPLVGAHAEVAVADDFVIRIEPRLAGRRAAQNLGDAAPADDVKINPYAVSLNPERWEADGMLGGEGLTVAEARESPAAGMENLFMEAIATPA